MPRERDDEAQVALDQHLPRGGECALRAGDAIFVERTSGAHRGLEALDRRRMEPEPDEARQGPLHRERAQHGRSLRLRGARALRDVAEHLVERDRLREQVAAEPAERALARVRREHGVEDRSLRVFDALRRRHLLLTGERGALQLGQIGVGGVSRAQWTEHPLSTLAAARTRQVWLRRIARRLRWARA